MKSGYLNEVLSDGALRRQREGEGENCFNTE